MIWDREQTHEIVGDDLMGMFTSWAKREWPYGDAPEQVVRAFALWCVSTPEGGDAIRRLKECPRQLSLQFPDDVRPWRAVVGVEPDGTEHRLCVAGVKLMLVLDDDEPCPACGRKV